MRSTCKFSGFWRSVCVDASNDEKTARFRTLLKHGRTIESSLGQGKKALWSSRLQCHCLLTRM